MTIEQLLHANAIETRRLCHLLRELVDVQSGAGVTVPRTLMLSSAEPFKTFRAQSAEQEFHAIRVDNFSTLEVDIKFDGNGPGQDNADERVPPMTGRIIVRPYSVAAVGFDPAVAPAVATPVRVTYYTRALPPLTYSLSGVTIPAGASAGSVVSKIALTGAEQVLLAANGGRKGAAIYNDSTATLYVKLGDNATADDWTVELNQNDYYELPAGYSGIVTAIASSATGQARVTELS